MEGAGSGVASKVWTNFKGKPMGFSNWKRVLKERRVHDDDKVEEVGFCFYLFIYF